MDLPLHVREQFERIEDRGALSPGEKELLLFLLESDRPLSAGDIIEVKDREGKNPFGNVGKDAIRQTAGRLRKRLNKYYETSADPIRFEVQLGKYFVKIIQRTAEEIASAVDKARQIGIQESKPTDRFRSNIPARGQLPFVGREAFLEKIKYELRELARERVVVLCGPAAVGKSELAREFARLHQESYTGGTFFIDASTDAIAIELARVGKNILNLPFPAHLPIDDQGQQTFFSLGSAPTLLVYDNVNSYEPMRLWIPLHGMSCHVLVTTVLESDDPAWPVIKIPPLKKNQSLEMVEKLASAEVAALYGNAIADHADGLPLEIIHHAKSAAYEYKRRRKYVCSGIGPDTIKSFSAVYNRLPPKARLLVHTAAFLNPQRIPQEELSSTLRTGMGWSAPEFERALDACLELHVLEGTADLHMHQLDARFINESELSPEDRRGVAQIRIVQFQRFVELAGVVADNPADTDAVGTLISYPLALAKWIGPSIDPVNSKETCQKIGKALDDIGRSEEAQPWFERAVAEAEKGDSDGRVDYAFLADSLHLLGVGLLTNGAPQAARLRFEKAVTLSKMVDVNRCNTTAKLATNMCAVGACLLQEGQLQEARLWCEQAVAEAEKGDLDGRVDHHVLASSLYSVAECILTSGRLQEAFPWCERAVAEAEKGDLDGRVDHEDLNCMLQTMAVSLLASGHFEEARPWLDRAEIEAKRGDRYGRLDHTALGSGLFRMSACLFNVGRFEESIAWCDRALAAAEKGNKFGRLDRQLLGDILGLAGNCLNQIGKFEDALSWLERSVTAMRPTAIR